MLRKKYKPRLYISVRNLYLLAKALLTVRNLLGNP